MATMIGSRNFDCFLKDYVREYGGKLVNSEVNVAKDVYFSGNEETICIGFIHISIFFFYNCF